MNSIANGPRPVIVIVDDEAPIRNAMSRFFERRGWCCIQAADGAEAEAVLFGAASADIDVVLCDVRLPFTSGLELFRRAQIERPALARCFVLSSGDLDGVDVACPVLAKPFPLAEVASLADAILSRNKAA